MFLDTCLGYLGPFCCGGHFGEVTCTVSCCVGSEFDLQGVAGLLDQSRRLIGSLVVLSDLWLR